MYSLFQKSTYLNSFVQFMNNDCNCRCRPIRYVNDSLLSILPAICSLDLNNDIIHTDITLSIIKQDKVGHLFIVGISLGIYF